MPLPALRPLTSLQRLTAKFALPRNPFTAMWYMLYGQALDLPERPSAPVLAMAAREHSFKDISFTFALIALSARVASLGGEVTKEKYVAFRAAFPIESGICDKLRALFTMASEDQTPFAQYVRHIVYAYPRRMPLFVALVDRLFRIAAAGSELGKEQEHMLAKIAHMLDLSPAQYSEIRTRHTRAAKPHEVLGLGKRNKSAELRSRYHELLRRYHPDRFATETLSPEVELLLQLKISEINDAYRRLAKKAA